MDLTHFYADMEKMKKWFNKRLTPDQEDQWFGKIKHIPPDAWEDIVSDITTSSKFFPTPATVTEVWIAWRGSHPERMAPEYKQTWCEECGGDGVFSVWYQDYVVSKEYIPPGKDPANYLSWYRMFVPCRKCPNWKRHFPTKGDLKPKRFYTKLDIIGKGWLLSDPFFSAENKLQPPIKNLQQLADMAFKDMPEVAQEDFPF